MRFFRPNSVATLGVFFLTLTLLGTILARPQFAFSAPLSVSEPSPAGTPQEVLPFGTTEQVTNSEVALPDNSLDLLPSLPSGENPDSSRSSVTTVVETTTTTNPINPVSPKCEFDASAPPDLTDDTAVEIDDSECLTNDKASCQQANQPLHAIFHYLGRADPYAVESSSALQGNEVAANVSGITLLTRICVGTPLGVDAPYTAYTQFPSYDTYPLSYAIGIDDLGNGQFNCPYIYLTGQTTVSNFRTPNSPGMIFLWDEVYTQPPENSLAQRIWDNYLSLNNANLPGFTDQQTNNRLLHIAELYKETLWHERQHELHFGRYLSVKEEILNTPKKPPENPISDGSITTVATARQYVLMQMAFDRSARISAAYTAWEQCSDIEFHEAVYAPNSYEKILDKCACTGIALAPPLPAAVPADCNQPPPAFDYTVNWDVTTTRYCKQLYADGWDTGIPDLDPP